MIQEIDINTIISTSHMMVIEKEGIREQSSLFLQKLQSIFKPKHQCFIIKGTYKLAPYKMKIYRHHIILELHPKSGTKKLFLSYEALSKETVSISAQKKQLFLAHFISKINEDISCKKAKTYVEERKHYQ